MYTDYRSSSEEYMMQGQVSEFMYRVYGWMSAALVVTAGVAYYVAHTPAIQAALFKSSGLLIGICIAQFALVLGLGLFINKMSYPVASIVFMVYSAMLGLTLSSIFVVYDMPSIGVTFLVTAGMFGAMCLYGYTTKSDLTTIGNIAMMALFGMVIAMLANLYFQNQTTDYIISGIGVLVFTALIAYDAQKIKQMGYQMLSHGQALDKVSVIGALMLYLDFVNLFLFLLRFLGNRKEN